MMNELDNVALHFYFNHTPEGMAIMDARRAELTESQRAFKEEVISSVEGQEMVAEKLEESEHYLVSVNERLDSVRKSFANCPDDQDWWWSWMLELLEERKRKAKSKVWRWRHLVQIEPGMVAMDDGGRERFDIEAIKEIPIDSLIGYAPSYRSDARWTFKCPVHNEKSASMVWYRTQNAWHCFGCGKGGSVIDLQMEMEGVDFITACRQLSKMA